MPIIPNKDPLEVFMKKYKNFETTYTPIFEGAIPYYTTAYETVMNAETIKKALVNLSPYLKPNYGYEPLMKNITVTACDYHKVSNEHHEAGFKDYCSRCTTNANH